MQRRDFLKLSAALPFVPALFGCAQEQKSTPKAWAWFSYNKEKSIAEYETLFNKLKQAGIDAILPNVYNSWGTYYNSTFIEPQADWLSQILPIAKKAELEVHAWMFSMPMNIPELAEKHPEWSSYNRNGEPAFSKPAYVDYYKFMCPNRPGVAEYVSNIASELAQQDIDGVHLDYIRYPDVILAEGLQPKYDIVQDKEYPEYDYCYCPDCQRLFREKYGRNPLEIKDPANDQEWRQFRYDSITKLVNNHLIPAIKAHNKFASAAVFPNWQSVRQQWSNWNLDAFFPMLYNNFYNAGIEWIGEQVKDRKQAIDAGQKLYSGLFVPELDGEKFAKAIQTSLKNGADGVAFFHAEALKKEMLENLSNILHAE